MRTRQTIKSKIYMKEKRSECGLIISTATYRPDKTIRFVSYLHKDILELKIDNKYLNHKHLSRRGLDFQPVHIS